MTTNKNTARAGAAVLTAALAASVLAGCTQPSTDPAAQAAVAYYNSIDSGTPANCDLTWAYRDDEANRIKCQQKVGPGEQLLLEPPTVVRITNWPGSPTGKGRAVVLALRLKTFSPNYAMGMDQDPTTGKWLMVDEGEIKGDVSQDANVLGALQ